MLWVDVKRIFRSGYVNFSRNGMVSLASVLIMTVTLGVIASVIFLQAILNFSLNEIKEKVDVTIYFNVGSSEDQIFSLKEALEKLPEVVKVDYISSEQALEVFKGRHQSDFLTLQALEELGYNPLGASLNVKAKETSQYENIAKFLESSNPVVQDSAKIIDKINYHQNKVVIDRLTALMDGARRLGLLASLLLSLVSIVIVFTTISLTIYISREEIGVMRLVGAANRYIRGPFLVEGAIYGVLASLLTMLILLPTTYWLGKNMTSFFGLDLFDYYLSSFWSLLGIIGISGIVLGMISSSLAIRKYLRK
jgi:cell division transport system permease protein